MSAVAATGPIALIPGRRLLAAVVPRATANASGGWWRWPNGVKPMTSTDSDAVVISAGHNGLLADADLSSAGWNVAVLEAQPDSGGGRVDSMGRLAGVRQFWGEGPLRLAATLSWSGTTLTVCRRFGMMHQEKS